MQAIAHNQEDKALPVLVQLSERVAGTMAYCDVVTARIAKPQIAPGGMHFEGPVPWDDPEHAHGFNKGVSGLEECLADISQNAFIGKYDGIGALLYRDNSRYPVRGGLSTDHEGMLTVPGYPDMMAPKGTGDGAYQARLAQIRGQLASLEETIKKQKALRASQEEEARRNASSVDNTTGQAATSSSVRLEPPATTSIHAV